MHIEMKSMDAEDTGFTKTPVNVVPSGMLIGWLD